MVFICSTTEYPRENETYNKQYFEKFEYPLHIFQKWAIEGIISGNHVLVTAPTGSGKSLPAEFAVDYFYSTGKKTIYCSPIKSLSNQKYNDFSLKYPHISIGLITGDIKCNPNADVLIMTTEILLNKLMNPSVALTYSFDLDIEKELGCVVFDEIHMIANESRGHVWENCIMLLPPQVQMVGLSATLADPEKFAGWLENTSNNKLDTSNTNMEKDLEANIEKKMVYLTSKKIRSVPLIHYSFITVPQGIFKSIKDKTVHQEINTIINKPFIIQDAKNKFDELQFYKMDKMLKLFASKQIRTKRAHAINQATKYLTEHEMTPAICYIFSIKNLELAAKEVATDLLEFDSKIPYTVANECQQILRRKLPNFDEYLQLPEYINLISLLEKGIAIHHSKMLPVLREIVEILFARGYIKLLFATETVAIGLNLPVKTCIFTDIYKHDGTELRILQAHEYTQAAGRAGRLGLDTVGHVFHLNNLFRDTGIISYKTMMNGTPQILVSRFKFSYHFLLSLNDTNNTNNTNKLTSLINNSMTKQEISTDLIYLENNIKTVKKEVEAIQEYVLHSLKTPKEAIEEYISLQHIFIISVNKKRKEIERKIATLLDTHRFMEVDKTSYERLKIKENELVNLEQKYNNTNSYINKTIQKIFELLREEDFINKVNYKIDTEDTESLESTKGSLVNYLKEVPCLIFAEIIHERKIVSFSPIELVELFGCFTNIKVQEDYKNLNPKTSNANTKLESLLIHISSRIDYYKDRENEIGVQTGEDYNINYDLLGYLENWCNAADIPSCKQILKCLEEEKGIFLGDFVKSLLKIVNISVEMERIAEHINNIELLHKLKQIPQLIMKYVVTNQSLYV